MPLALAEQPVVGTHGARATADVCAHLGSDRFSVDGRELQVPMRMAALSMFAQVFSVPARALRPWLDTTQLRAVEIWPGTSALVLMAVEYYDSPLGAYREAACFSPVHAPGERTLPGLGGLQVLRQRASYLIHAMPVDQEFTAHAGRFLWGYPKFLAQLEIELGADTARARFSHQQQLVFGMQVPLRTDGKLKQRVTNLTEYGGVLRRVEAEVEGTGFAFRLGGDAPEVGDTHPLAQTLRSLGLPKRPLCSLSLRDARAEFGAAQELALSAPSPSRT